VLPVPTFIVCGVFTVDRRSWLYSLKEKAAAGVGAWWLPALYRVPAIALRILRPLSYRDTRRHVHEPHEMDS
jgi:hypothetical protein